MIILSQHRLSESDFLARLSDAAETFLGMGLSHCEARAMLANLEWVQGYIYHPKMFDYAAKLPRGCKWSQGTRLGKEKPGKINGNYRDWAKPGVCFLEVGEDLYIRDLCDSYRTNPDGSIWHDPDTNLRYREPAIAVIHNWRQYLACEVVGELERCWRQDTIYICDGNFPHNIRDAFFEWWHSHDLPLYISDRLKNLS